ncbi:MAG: Luciferase family protein [Mycobacterium sp.]|nr:Luciferase family protein [Mycobacterium sp.]
MRISIMVFPQPDDPRGLDGVVSEIAAAADAEFSRAWVPQLPPMNGVAGWDALTVLALAGQRVPDIELATGVVVAYAQHPLVMARNALTTSAAVGGRLVLGIGVSHRAMVADVFGYAYEAPAAYLREYLEVLTPALAGEPVDHHGQRLTAVGQVLAPGASAPPVITAALGPLMLDLAGELTDGTVTSWAGPRALENDIIPRITKAAAGACRPAPQIIAGLPVAVTSDPDSVRAQLAQTYQMAEQTPAYRAILAKEGAAGVADVSIVGDEQEVTARLRRFADVGVSEFVGSPHGDADTRARTVEFLAATRV